MAIIALKAWYLEDYEPIKALEKRPHDLRLSKNSLLKSALRADFLEDSETVKTSSWFQRYIEGDTVEFYVEGSGTYAISNIDLISHEIYFTKQDVFANLDPTLFFCYQDEFADSSNLLREELQAVLTKLNERSRVQLTLEESHRLSEGPARLGSGLTRKIRKCLLFIGDATPIARLDTTPPQLIPSPKVCVEVGYALQSKRPEQILLAQMEREQWSGQFPFDIAGRNRIEFGSKSELHKSLPKAVEEHLARFNLWS